MESYPQLNVPGPVSHVPIGPVEGVLGSQSALLTGSDLLDHLS